jgi:hypothetical protein
MLAIVFRRWFSPSRSAADAKKEVVRKTGSTSLATGKNLLDGRWMDVRGRVNGSRAGRPNGSRF